MITLDNINGTDISDYLLCKRKFYLSKKGFNLGEYNENVQIGKVIEQNSYKRRSDKYKNFNIYLGKVDYIDLKNKIIYETKKSSKRIESSTIQVKYYLYILKSDFKGIIEIPKEKKKINVYLNDDDILFIEKTLKEMIDLYNNGIIPTYIKNMYCNGCMFNNYCSS